MNIFLSERLKKLRKEKGNTQEDLAMHLGITPKRFPSGSVRRDTPILRFCLPYHPITT